MIHDSLEVYPLWSMGCLRVYIQNGSSVNNLDIDYCI